MNIPRINEEACPVSGINLPTINTEACPASGLNTPVVTTETCPGGTTPNLPEVETATCPVDDSTVVLTPALVLKPGTVTACAPGFVQFETYLRTGLGEAVTNTRLVTGLTYSSANAALAAITPLDGAANLIAAGTVTITVQYGSLSATATITIRDGDDCCDEIKISTVLLLDNSKSMGMTFSGAYATKLDAAKAIAVDYAGEILAKDEMGLVLFSNFTSTLVAPTSEMADIITALAAISQSTGNTRLDLAFDAGKSLLDAADGAPKVMVFISDGHEQPEFTAADRSALLTKASAFKASGGIIICCGIKADIYGFGLLAQLASPGFLINAYGEGETPITDSVDDLVEMLSLYCGGTPPVPFPTPSPWPSASVAPPPSPSPSASPSASPSPSPSPSVSVSPSPSPSVSVSPSPSPSVSVSPSPSPSVSPSPSPSASVSPSPSPSLPPTCCDDTEPAEGWDTICGASIPQHLSLETCLALCAEVVNYLNTGTGGPVTFPYWYPSGCIAGIVGDTLESPVCVPCLAVDAEEPCCYVLEYDTSDPDDCNWTGTYSLVACA